ncbi:hypothetical protein C0V72_06790 [Porphyrobacter sp. TH134]|nr:hypothetical protein C0V72_06790 [Porphyrobacter sp. TH134]
MHFVPLRYVIGTLTVWHGVALLAIMAPSAYAYVTSTAAKPTLETSLPRLFLLSFMAVWMYCLAALVLGRLFGDKFPFAQVWPSALALGFSMAVVFVACSLAFDGKTLTLELALFSVFGIAFFTLGLALFACIAIFLMPRAVGFGLVDWPKASWGVHLYRAP